MTATYEEFLERKTQFGDDSGFAPAFMPDCMFDFQKYLVEFALRTGRGGVLADCGMGKTLCELVWAENIVHHTNGRVLVMTPNAVSAQTVAEGEKFGIEAVRSKGGILASGKKIIVSNYEQLKHFDPNDFVAFVGDEASILKNAQGGGCWMKAKRKLVPIPERTDGGGIPRDTAGCPKCDDEMPMLSDIHHSDGSVCKVMARNYAALERSGLEPMGRYSPSQDRYDRQSISEAKGR